MISLITSRSNSNAPPTPTRYQAASTSTGTTSRPAATRIHVPPTDPTATADTSSHSQAPTRAGSGQDTTPVHTPTRKPTSAAARALFYAEVISNERLRVRGGPSLDEPIIDHVYSGECLSVWDWSSATRWYKIKSPRNVEGWVYSAWMRGHTSSRCDGQVTVPGGILATFSASPDHIRPKQCTEIAWNVTGAQQVLFEFGDRGDRDSIRVCHLEETHTFLLIVTLKDGTRWIYPQTVVVDEDAPPSTSAPMPQKATPAPPQKPPAVKPLTFEAKEVGKWCTTGFGYAANFELRATGGTGSYTYYMDNQKIVGPVSGSITHAAPWSNCSGMPRTFSAESGTQRIDRELWVSAPSCCRR